MDKTLKSLSSIANMHCATCFIKNNFMYFYHNQYYCSECIDVKSKIEDYKHLM
jgi:hypothetical protein